MAVIRARRSGARFCRTPRSQPIEVKARSVMEGGWCSSPVTHSGRFCATLSGTCFFRFVPRCRCATANHRLRCREVDEKRVGVGASRCFREFAR